MAFIILGDREQEWERRPLRAAITIGRSFDCDLPVRDTLLSRHHCRLEPHGKRWVLIDLKSKNGTRVGDQQITQYVLEDGDQIFIGQTRVCFRAGAFVPPAVISPSPAGMRRTRPLDPHEALAATMTGASLAVLDAQTVLPHFPTPKPKPVEPKAFSEENVAALVGRMASSSWDKRLANRALTRRPTRNIPWADAASQIETPVEAEIETRVGLRKNSPSPQRKSSMQNKATTPASAQAFQKPARWLVMTYLVMTAGVFAGSLCAIVML